MNYFEIFNIKQKFAFTQEDFDMLEKSFLTLHKQNHHNQDGKLNLAYETIKDEIKRLEYLMKIQEIDALSINMEPEFAEYIFETREQIEDANSKEVIENILKEVNSKLESVKISLNNEFKNKSLNQKQKNIVCNLFSQFKPLNEILKVYQIRDI